MSTPSVSAPSPRPGPSRPGAARARRTFLLVMGLVLLVGVGGIASQTGGTPQPSSAEAAVSVTGWHLVDARGATTPLTPTGGGQVLLVSTTCSHCHATLARLASQMRGHPERLPHLRIVAVQGAAPGQLLLDSLGLPLQALAFDRPQERLAQLHVPGVPFLMTLSPAGAVTGRAVGALSADEVAALVAATR